LHLRYGRAHRFGPFLKLSPNAIGLNGLFMAIPRKAFNAYCSEIATETTKPLYQSHLHARSRSG
jgi:hypothetical protein